MALLIFVIRYWKFSIFLSGTFRGKVISAVPV